MLFVVRLPAADDLRLWDTLYEQTAVMTVNNWTGVCDLFTPCQASLSPRSPAARDMLVDDDAFAVQGDVVARPQVLQDPADHLP